MTMDYESIHGKGDSNFSSPLSHRMPTVSAAQALQILGSTSGRCISTNLPLLDACLQNGDGNATDNTLSFGGGISRGRVTEIYGPPGVGKTTIGIQLAVNALLSGHSVHWVDAGHPICGPRVLQILTPESPNAQPGTLENRLDLLNNLTHITTPTLAHLLAILSHPNPPYLVERVSLLVIDSFSTLINNAFPRNAESSNTGKKPGQKPPPRRFPILQYISSVLQKLAATQNIAIVIISQCVTKMKPGSGATLVPAVNTTAWEQGLGARVVLYRDFGWEDKDGNSVDDVRFAQVLKAEGVNVSDGRLRSTAFAIKEHGLQPLNLPIPSSSIPHHIPNLRLPSTTTSLPQKRKAASNNFEIPDSDAEDDEDYGWAEEDEQELPAPPPQWQGSEDILITRGDLVEDEDGDEELEGARSPAAKVRRVEIEDSEDELA